MKKIVFLGAKDIGLNCFQTLVEQAEQLNYEIIGAFPAPRGEKIAKHARNSKIPVYTDIQSLLNIPNSDLIISVQYDKILRAEHLRRAKLAVNLHLAPLPEYRGCNQFSFAIVNEEKEFGATLHAMDEKVDHGDILAQKRFAIPENCFVEELVAMTNQSGLELFKESLPFLLNESFKPQCQGDVKSVGKSYYYYERKDIDAIKEIDLSWPQHKIEKYIRATLMPGFSPPYFIVSGKKIGFYEFDRKDSL